MDGWLRQVFRVYKCELGTYCFLFETRIYCSAFFSAFANLLCLARSAHTKIVKKIIFCWKPYNNFVRDKQKKSLSIAKQHSWTRIEIKKTSNYEEKCVIFLFLHYSLTKSCCTTTQTYNFARVTLYIKQSLAATYNDMQNPQVFEIIRKVSLRARTNLRSFQLLFQLCAAMFYNVIQI